MINLDSAVKHGCVCASEHAGTSFVCGDLKVVLTIYDTLFTDIIQQ